MPICRECSQPKSADEFYKAGGRLMKKCKVCWGAQVKKRRRENPAVQAYDRARYQLPHRKALGRANTIKYRRDNPEAYRAQTAVGNAIRDGKLAKGEACEVPGCVRTDVHAHHEDYSKPLEVRWLCPLHHHRHHHEETL